MTKPCILLIGGGGHCHSCIDVIERCDTFKIAGIIEQPEFKKSYSVLGYNIIGTDKDLKHLRNKFDWA